MADEKAVSTAIKNATEWLLDGNWQNLLIEINNECDVPAYDHELLKPARVHEAIVYVKSQHRNGRRLLVGTSFGGGSLPSSNVIRESDFILLHGNGVSDPRKIESMVEATRSDPNYKKQPILFNEDDHFDFDKPENNFIAAVKSRASWGYFDYRLKGEDSNAGYQSVPRELEA